MIEPSWLNIYETIIVIDDSPNVWKNTSESIHFLVPKEFRGSSNDTNLSEIINKLNSIV